MNHTRERPCHTLTCQIIKAATLAHHSLGAGRSEAVYQQALQEYFRQVNLNFKSGRKIPVYDGGRLLGFYIPDFIVENRVIVEVKSFSGLPQQYVGQMLAYLDYTGLPVGLLLNFGRPSLSHRHVFWSNRVSEFRPNHQWLVVPDWLNQPTYPTRLEQF